MNTASYSVPLLRLPSSVSLTLPESKSHANRALIVAVLTEGETILNGVARCDDVLVMIRNLQKMGFDIQWMDRAKGVVRVQGGMPTQRKHRPVILDCHNAGTTLRFLVSLTSIVAGKWLVTGNHHMKKRPIKPLVDALCTLGVPISSAEGGTPPVHITGGGALKSSVEIDASMSSQYLSSLLMIAPMLPDGLTIHMKEEIASEQYVRLTEQVMRDFGISIKKENNCYTIPHQSYHSPKKYTIEGDWSAAGPWLALNAITRSSITFTNLNPHSTQSDRALPSIIETMKKNEDITIDCTHVPDQLMNLCVIAAHRSAKTTFIGAKNLRLKECNRLQVITQELSKLGVPIHEHDDGVIVDGSYIPPHPENHPITLNPSADHRMVMAFAIIGMIRGGVLIEDPKCVQKSYSNFFQDLKKVLKNTRPIAIIGMRGVGKSSLARRIASLYQLPCVDTDRLIAKHIGSELSPFIIHNGWSAFRQVEAKIIAEAMQHGRVISLGGGAIETESVRQLLQEKAIVLWISADASTIIHRLEHAKKKRPSLTGKSHTEEVPEILKKRNPLYESLADITIDGNQDFSVQEQSAIEELSSFLLASWI